MIQFFFGFIFVFFFIGFAFLLSLFGVNLVVSGTIFSFIVGVIVGICVVYGVWGK